MTMTMERFKMRRVVLDLLADGWTRRRLYGELGIDPAEVSRMMRGHSPNMRIERIEEIAASLNITVSELLERGKEETEHLVAADFHNI